MMTLLALCDRKSCFLNDLKNVTMEEIRLWLAFYQIEREEIEETTRK